MSITDNKKRIPLLHLHIKCISARFALQILSMKNECTFLLLDFLMIVVCNSSSNSLLEMFYF